METVEEIWEGDLFNRCKEAEDLAGYLECVAGRPAIREDGHAHVLAVDTEYGFGKSYFLRRLARHMRRTHAVAFVDAWVDDLQDEPIVALAATLEDALAPWIPKSKPLQKNLANFKAKAGRVAKIVGTGLAKRAVGFVITQGAADVLGETLTNADDIDKDLRKDALKDGVKESIVDTGKLLESAETLMNSRISKFREGKLAIESMKSELSNIVESLTESGMRLSITIIVDELDRCRPTYAIKLLEEIKHLFDVPGVAFVLGMHGQQLSHSVSAAYGASFNGSAYLKRFFNRRYILRSAELTPLIQKLIDELSIPVGRFVYPQIRQSGSDNRASAIELPHLIRHYMDLYGISARDVFEFMEMLQTCAALTGDKKIIAPYIIPLIVGHMQGGDSILPIPKTESRISYVYYSSSQNGGRWIENTLHETSSLIHDASQMDDSSIINALNRGQVSASVQLVADARFGEDNKQSYSRPENYVSLMRAVERFS